MLPRPEDATAFTSASDVARLTVPLHRSVAARSFLAVVSVLLVVMAALSTIAIRQAYGEELRDLESNAESQARFLATVSPEAMFFRDYLTLETLVRQAMEDPSTVHVVFLDNAGSSMTRFVDLDDPIVAGVLGGVDSPDAASTADLVATNTSVEEIRYPIISEGTQLGHVRLAYSVESARSDAKGFAIQAVVVTVLSAAGVVILTLLTFRRYVRRPLQLLTEKIHAVASGDLTERVAVERGDEIGALQWSFNEMARELEGTLVGLERARDDAEKADRATSEFLANMSHEIRTPLNAVLGLTDVLLDSGLTAGQRDLLTTMHQSGDALLEMLNEILDFSKLESGRLEVDAELFDVCHVVDATLDMFAAECSRKSIELRSDIEIDRPRYVVGDEGRVRQVLVNLVGNAIKFTDHGSVLVRVQHSPSDGPTSVRFSVVDSGIGIDPDQVDRLFEPFRQGDSTTTRMYGGTGLGLTICQRLVDAMGGSIEATGSMGIGSSFSFVLPLPVQAVPPKVGPVARRESVDDATMSARFPLRVLLAEDNPVNQLVATRLFARLGYDVDIAHDGVQAVDMAAASQYDLVLMDIQMPRLDGVQAAQRIRTSLPDHRCPRIIAFTAHALAGDRDYYLGMGMDGYVSKPIRLDGLVEVLQSTTRLADERDDHTTDPLDRAQLRQLLGDGADTLLDELITLFRRDGRERVTVMAEAVVDGDPESLERAAHALKGGARSLAANELADVCERLERQARRGRLDGATRMIRTIEEQLDRIDRLEMLVPLTDCVS